MNRNIELKRQMSRPNRGSKCRLVSADYYGPLAEAFIWHYMDMVDKTFGIRFINGKFMIVNKIIKIQGNNIVNWSLHWDTGFVDFKSLKRILRNMMKKITWNRAHLRYQCALLCSYPRANISMKWKTILHPIWEDFRWERVHHVFTEKRTLFQSSSARSWNTSHTMPTVRWYTGWQSLPLHGL